MTAKLPPLQSDVLPSTPTGHRQRVLGSVYTPREYADLLVRHGICNKDDRILDIGVGQGVFTLAAYERLIHCGALPQNAEKQIYGTEIDEGSYRHFLQVAADHGRSFPHIRCGDFFKAELPQFDAVIGNPPYVRRTYLDDVNAIREVVAHDLLLQGRQELRRSTDLYIYFLLHAATLLKPGGRLSIIVADPWLTVGYGQAFKQYLLKNFEIKSLISFDRRVFHDADVKPVLLMAQKRAVTKKVFLTTFVRVRNGLPVVELQNRIFKNDLEHPDINVVCIEQQKLDAERTWALYFKAGEAYDRISQHPRMSLLKDIAHTSIGVQTLARTFFVLTPAQVREHDIENEYIRPLANSNRTHGSPTIEVGQIPEHLVFYCNKSKSELIGTHALKYIEAAEQTPVPVRGKNKMVIGYHSKERIQLARRQNWYDLKTLMVKRGHAEILLPRLVYSTFRVVWNRAQYTPGELFIEIKPFQEHLKEIDVRVYLAILNSAPTELALRVQAQLYGGGTFNINPGPAKQVPVLAPIKLTSEERHSLVTAYQEFLDDPLHNVGVLNNAVFTILEFDKIQSAEVLASLDDLRRTGAAAKIPQYTRHNN